MSSKISADAKNVSDFVDNVGRQLFKEAQYDELDNQLHIFFASNTARTVSECRSFFYRRSLPRLINNFIFPEYGDFSGLIKWNAEFPHLIEVINPLYVSDATPEWTLPEYLANCSHRKVTMISIISEVISTIKAFLTKHTEFSKQ